MAISGWRRTSWGRVTRTTRTKFVLPRSIAVSILSPRTCRRCRRGHGVLSRIYPIFVFLSLLKTFLSASSLCFPLCFLLCHPSFIFGTSLFLFFTFRNAFKLVKLLFFTIKCVAFLIIRTCAEGTSHSGDFDLFCSCHAMGICWFE